MNPIVRDQVESARMIGQRAQDMIRAPAEAWGRMVDSGYRPTGQTDDPMRDQMAQDSFDVAGAVPVAGLAAATVRPGVSLGAGGGKLTKSLPMDEASRMARAREMGFDTERVWHHGTAPTGWEFRDGQFVLLGENFDEFKPGSYFAQNKDYAEGFAKAQASERALGNGPRVIDAMLRLQNPYRTEDLSYWRKLRANAAAETARLKALGHDGIIMKEVPDDHVMAGEVAYVFDPRNIRRTDAAFDPDQVDSANILAANSSRAAIPGLLQSWPEE